MIGCDGGCDRDVPELRILPSGTVAPEYHFTLKTRHSHEEWLVTITNAPGVDDVTPGEAYNLARSEAQDRANLTGQSVLITADGEVGSTDYVEPQE